jgi:hypothetical protein
MRMLGMGFGLISLLICTLIVVKMEVDTAVPDIQAGDKAKQQIQQIAGVADDGTHIENTYDLIAEKQADGRLHDLLVTRLQPDSPLKTFFGLQENDKIVSASYEAVDFGVSDAEDEESAKLSVREAYTHSGQLTVMRNGQKLTLPIHAQAAQGQPTPQQQNNQNDPMQQINDRLHLAPAGN